MEYEITNQPAFAELVLTLEAGEEIRAESGALVSYSGTVELSPGTDETPEHASLGEGTPFSTTFAADQPGTVRLAPPFPGDIFRYELRDESLYVQSCSFLAAESGIDFEATFSGEEAFVKCAGDFLLELSGAGLAFLSSYGAVSVVSLDPGERYVVDTGHVVAFEGPVDFDVHNVDGLRSPGDGRGGLLSEFEGPGTIWLQSRSPVALLSWLLPNMPGEHSQR
ncbi:TIGR00266 family protein [Haladaptatus sp. AB618]|uniref:TIGR00266 family protein n=1 Tax=Haladaptatus sp. AB618 TaxID=2934173 RepID=UPI00209BC6C3|nr:TIGR00266 family protein [Haladaptatus sp. AB618]MCO8253655.1 TIGR00266 family protein [Haladaptatus sp. AB618]